MKTSLICTLIATICCITASAHERITVGPNKGRLIMLDSTSTLNVEFTLKDNKAQIEVPAAIDGLWAELNQHHTELKEGYKDKAYEALDEVTDAFPILAAALPEKSKGLGEAQQKSVEQHSETVVKALAEIKKADSARKLKDAKSSVDTIASLKKNYPEATANAKLGEEH